MGARRPHYEEMPASGLGPTRSAIPSSTLDEQDQLSDDRTLASAGGSRMAEPSRGQQLGGVDGQRFELLERLGGGGMATVYLARDTILDRAVAIKFITHEDVVGSETIERVRLEARACARLSHENIVRLFDMGTDQGLPYLIMEHLDGRPLDAILNEEGVDARRAVRIMIDVARGLSQAHRAGIVHRDLKPNNVFIVRDGTAKILDFGVATMTARPDVFGKELSGTPRYMSPEQWKGEAQDGRTDIWAAGVMFFELLAGRLPFIQPNIFDLREAVTSSEAAPSLRDARPDLPEKAEQIAARALKKNAAERFGTADELLDSLIALEVGLTEGMCANLEASERPPRPKPERRQTTLLSCSLCGMLTLSEELDLDELGELLDAFFEICATVVRQLGGTMLSSLGGRVVACFGFPTAHEDDTQRALRAASLIVDAVRSRTRADGQPYAARVGIHTNLSIAGRSQRPSAPLLLQGDAPELARWLEYRAGPNEILIGQRTRVLAQTMFEVEALGEALPDGATRPVPIYRVLRPKTGSSRFDPMAGGALTPLVGRDRELDELRTLWDSAQAGSGQFAWVVGEAGIGKSRLVARHLEQMATDPHTIVRCQCWPHFQNSALEPIVEGLLRSIGLHHEVPPPEKVRRLEEALVRLDLRPLDYVPLFAAFLGMPTGELYPLPESISPDLLKKRMLGALVTLLTRLSIRQTTIVIVEDAHWADALTVDLLDLLLREMSRTNLMVIVTARAEFQPAWSQRSHLKRLALSRLSPRQTAAMIAFASQGRVLPLEVVEELVNRTDGVPLFVEELTSRVADALHESEQRGEIMAAGSLASKVIPATLEELLRARLDVLPPDGKEVARLISVLGSEATYELVCLASELPEAPLRAGLMQLVESGLLRQQGQGMEAQYTFKHALVHEAAYQSLVKSKRQALHRRAATVLVERFGSTVEQRPELVGGHFMEAGCHEHAVIYLQKAGERAAQRSANVDAATHYSRALAELRMLPANPTRDRRELSLQLAIGTALMAIGKYGSPEVREAYVRARELSRESVDDDPPFPSAHGLWRFSVMAGETAASIELGMQLVAQAERSSDRALTILARRALGISLFFVGDYAAARGHVEAALALYDAKQHRDLARRFGHDPGVTSGVNLAWALWGMGLFDQAVERGRTAVQMAQQTDNPMDLSYALGGLANVHNRRGEHHEALRLADEAIAVAEEHGPATWLATARIERACARLGAGEREGAQELQEAVTAYRKTGANAGVTSYLACLTRTQFDAGQIDRATRTLDEAMVIVETNGERMVETELLRLRGQLLLATGKDGDPRAAAAAAECFERSLVVARKQKAHAWELRAAHSYARLLVKLSRGDEARALLAPVVAQFTEGRDTRDVREAYALLASLSAAQIER